MNIPKEMANKGTANGLPDGMFFEQAIDMILDYYDGPCYKAYRIKMANIDNSKKTKKEKHIDREIVDKKFMKQRKMTENDAQEKLVAWLWDGKHSEVKKILEGKNGD